MPLFSRLYPSFGYLRKIFPSRGLKYSLCCSLIATGTRFYQDQWLSVWTRSCLYVVCMYWTRLVLVRPAANIKSASPRKHHATGRQLCPNPDHYPDSEPASRSLTRLCWALSRAAEPQILTFFCLTRPGIDSPTPMWGEHSITTLPGRGG